MTNYKSFRFGKVSFEQKRTAAQCIVTVIHPRKHSKAHCSECGKPCPYDASPTFRCFEFVPLWNIPVFFDYKMRRVSCPEHGVIVERIPWGDGKCTQTIEQRLFLANWARRLSWSEVAEYFHTTFDKVFRAVKWLVEYGLEHRNLDVVKNGKSGLDGL